MDRLLKNSTIFAKLQDDPDFKRIVKEYVRQRVYERQRGTLARA